MAEIKVGEMRTVLPPIGKDSIIAQGHQIPMTGKKIMIDKQLLVLHAAGMIRIATDIINPKAFDHMSPPKDIAPKSPIPPEVLAAFKEVQKPRNPILTDSPANIRRPLFPDQSLPQVNSTPEVVAAMSVPVSEDAVEAPNSSASSFSTQREIMETRDYDGLRKFLEAKTGNRYDSRKSLEQLKTIAIRTLELEGI